MTKSRLGGAIAMSATTVVSLSLAVLSQLSNPSTLSSYAGMTKHPTQSRIIVAPPVKISRPDFSWPDLELQIATDPNDARRLIACSAAMDDGKNFAAPFPFHLFVYASRDGGLNWFPTYDSDKEQYSVDPTCAFGPDGTAYAMSFGGDIYASLRAVRREVDYDSKDFFRIFIPRRQRFMRWPLRRSTDGGTTWSEVGAGEVDGLDREYITVDDTVGKYRGRVYIHGIGNGSAGIGVAGIDGSRITGLVIFRSEDGGKTFKSVKLADEGSQYVIGNANGVVMSDGTFATIFADATDMQTAVYMNELHPKAPNTKLKFIASEDGGETFNKTTVISADWYLRESGALNGLPSLAVDRTQGPFRDQLYAAWVDARSGRGEIRFSRSTDRGRTWSPEFVISDNFPHDEHGETPDAFMPTLAVNRNGVLGVMWYDRRDHPDNLGYDIRFSASLDGGESFLPSVLVSPGGGSVLQMKQVRLDKPWRATAKVDGHFHGQFGWDYTGDNGGDTAGLACDLDGIFHALWIDRRFGLPQASTTRITVNGTAMPNGGDGLESLHDMSAKAEVHYSGPSLDFATNVITIDAVITNTSKEPIPGNLTLRLLQLSSSSGPIEVQSADNGAAFAGATWDFHAASGGFLAPAAMTVPRQLRFRLAHAPFPPPPIRDYMRPGLVEMESKILGK